MTKKGRSKWDFAKLFLQEKKGAERILIRNLIYLILFGLLFLIIYVIFFKAL